jgi:hypothetical protein
MDMLDVLCRHGQQRQPELDRHRNEHIRSTRCRHVMHRMALDTSQASLTPYMTTTTISDTVIQVKTQAMCSTWARLCSLLLGARLISLERHGGNSHIEDRIKLRN